jgi:hypothetical protein
MLTICLLSLACDATVARAVEWTSPDGVIKITVPDAAKLEPLETPPTPFLALWMSADESLRIGVMQRPFPTHQGLLRSAADEGFAEEIGGSITAATTATNNGHEIWLTTASGSSNGTKMTGTQAIVRVNDSVYKIMAMTVGDAPVDDATIQTFLQSIQVTGTPHPGGIAGSANASSGSKAPLTSDELTQNVSYQIGRAVGMILMILLVVWVVSLFNRKPRQPNPTTQYPPGPPMTRPPTQ